MSAFDNANDQLLVNQMVAAFVRQDEDALALMQSVLSRMPDARRRLKPPPTDSFLGRFKEANASMTARIWHALFGATFGTVLLGGFNGHWLSAFIGSACGGMIFFAAASLIGRATTQGEEAP